MNSNESNQVLRQTTILPQWKEMDPDIKRYFIQIGISIIVLLIGLMVCLSLNFNDQIRKAIAEKPGDAWHSLWKSAKKVDDLKDGWEAVQCEWKKRGVNITWKNIEEIIQYRDPVTDTYVLNQLAFSKYGGLCFVIIVLTAVPCIISIIVCIVQSIKNKTYVKRNELALLLFVLIICVSFIGIIVSQGRLYAYLLKL